MSNHLVGRFFLHAWVSIEEVLVFTETEHVSSLAGSLNFASSEKYIHACTDSLRTEDI